MLNFVMLQAAMFFSFLMIASIMLVFILSFIFSWICYLKKHWNKEFSWKTEFINVVNSINIDFDITILFIGILLMLFLIWNPTFM